MRSKRRNRAGSRPLSGTIAMLALGLTLATFSATRADIRWRTGPASDQPQAAADARAALADVRAQADARHLVVQFAHPITAPDRAALDRSGLTLLSYLGDNAFFAALTGPDADIDAIAALPSLASAWPVARQWKLAPAIVVGEYPDYARGVDPGSNQELVAANVLFHTDVSLVDEAVPAVERHGATVVYELLSLNGLVIELPLANLEALADEDVVQWIEPPLPFMTETNDNNQVRVQADTVQGVPYNLDGSGVTVLVYDGAQARATHVDFGGRLTTHDDSGIHYHSTHVAGTIGGSGAASGGTYAGMAPGVLMRSYGFQYDGTDIFLYSNPGDLESDYDQAINTYGADIANNSIGTNTETNGFPCSIQGDYGVTSALIDSIVTGSLGAPFRIVWAAGNERQGSRCDVEGYGDYYSTAPPAGAKNHISVGGLNSNNDTMTSFSSWGPVDDGRLKPDVAAPGCQSSGDYGVTSCSSSSDTAYTTLCGTSMAAPTVTGCLALLLEDFRIQFPAEPDPRNSTLKILLAHNAVDLGNTGPDYQYGYGSVRIQDTIDFMRTGQFEENQVGQGGTVTYQITLPVSEPLLKVTLAWDDPPGTPNVNPALVNDLDLVVFDPFNQQAYPWTLNPTSPSSAAVRTNADHVNNIEQVVVNNPLAGTWTIQVSGYNVPEGPQVFSICATPQLSGGPVNQAPIVDAGLDQTVEWPNSANLDGTVTDDGLPDPPGTVTVTWSKVSGPGTVTFGNANAVDTTADFSVAGIYVLQLLADDGELTASDQTTITVVPNQPPTVDAGPDQSITLPAVANLDGTVTDDGLPDPPGTVTVTWSKVSGPGTVTFGDANAVDTTAQFSTAGTYVLQLLADDGALTASDQMTVVVEEAPPYVDDVANADVPVVSTLSGTYVDTHANDGAYEVITERESGGKPSSRYSYLEHKWTINVTGGNAVTCFLNAYHSASSDGDNFVFSYSTDNVNYTDMFTLLNTSDDGSYESYTLPNTTAGTVYIRVVDTDRTPGNRVLDSVYVDHLFIRSETGPGEPPAAPTALMAMAIAYNQIDLAWTDNSDNEAGFEIDRSLNGIDWDTIDTVGADVTVYPDTELAASTTYYYRVRAFNGYGNSAYSNTASATTLESPGIVLTGVGFTLGSKQVVDLDWTGATSSYVDIYRDGKLLTTTLNDGAYRDSIGKNITGTFIYQVCEEGTTNCSNVVTIEF